MQNSYLGFMLVSMALAAHLCSHQCLEGTAPGPWWTFGVLFTALWVVTGWGDVVLHEGVKRSSGSLYLAIEHPRAPYQQLQVGCNPIRSGAKQRLCQVLASLVFYPLLPLDPGHTNSTSDHYRSQYVVGFVHSLPL